MFKTKLTCEALRQTRELMDLIRESEGAERRDHEAALSRLTALQRKAGVSAWLASGSVVGSVVEVSRSFNLD